MRVEAKHSFFESLKKIGSFSGKIKSVRVWLKYHFKKEFRLLLGTTLKSYPWDYSYLYELEQAKIKEMIEYHKKANRFVGVEYAIRDMEICVKLIDIFLGKKDLFHYDGDIVFKPIEGSDDYTVEHTPDFKYNCDVYVNTRNINRFVSEQCDYYREHKHELYVLKAKALYHKIRNERDFEWWD